MKRRLALSTLTLLFGIATQTFGAIDRTIDGLPNIEDLVSTAEGRWVIASSMSHEPESPGGLYILEVKTRIARKAKLAPAAGTPTCPQGFDPTHFMPHGIDRVGNE